MFKRILRSVFPAPRQTVTWRSAISLIVFLAIYAGVCLYLDLSQTLFFANPEAFVFMLASIWVWWMSVVGYSGLTRGRAVMVMTVRLSLVGLFVMLMAEPRAVRTSDVLSVVYAIDISDSIGDNSTDKALGFVTETVQHKPEKDEAGLVVFGRNAAVELPPRISFPFEALNSRIDRDATDLEQSLSLAAAMLPEESRGRIVLISDGTETAGSFKQTIKELKAREISVDILPIEYDYDEEVWIERLELPRMVKLGENYVASAVLSSLKSGTGTIYLRENGKIIAEEPVEFKEGKNRVSIPIYLREPGYYEYSATIEVDNDNDNLKQNNTVINYIYVEGEGKVLIVTEPGGDSRDWADLVKAIQQGKRAVETMSAYEFPRDSLTLLPYDLVIFNNVSADTFDTIQLKAMHDAVYDMGIGFMMVGGENSYGPGGYHRTVIEDALPVTMDITNKKVLPKGALAIILHTCEFAEGNTWGKRITKQAIKVLGDQDEVGVLVYGAGGEQWLFELTPASEYEKLVPKINGAMIGDMPSFANTMRLGLEGLKKSDASAKHMIIISDGDPQAPAPAMIDDYIKEKISISMVAIFPHGGQDISKMRSISEVTGGRYYFPDDPSLLPSIFIKESKTLKRSMIQNEIMTPVVGFPSPILKGLDGLPPLHGYVLTSIKERSEQILHTPSKDEVTGEIDPVLAKWRYGLGTTAAFTSDLSRNWGADWLRWDQYQAFVQQLVTSVSRVEKQNHLRMWTYTSGSEGVIMVEDFHPEESFLDVKARIAGPRGQTESVQLKQIGPRRYQASVSLWGKGRYQVIAQGAAGERTERANGGFIVPYSPEYLRFRSNPIILEEIAKDTGGKVLSYEPGPETDGLTKAQQRANEIYQTRRKPKQSSSPIFDWFLIGLACMIPLDVAFRRIQIDLKVIKGWLGLGQKAPQSTQTMGALLKRKQAVDSQINARRDDVTAAPFYTSSTPRPTKNPVASAGRKPSEAPPAPELPAADTSSTTGRLLAMKRKRNEDRDDE